MNWVQEVSRAFRARCASPDVMDAGNNYQRQRTAIMEGGKPCGYNGLWIKSKAPPMMMDPPILNPSTLRSNSLALTTQFTGTKGDRGT